MIHLICIIISFDLYEVGLDSFPFPEGVAEALKGSERLWLFPKGT